MWAEFEWENKVVVNTNITNLSDYLQHILKSTNMKCLTPEKVRPLRRLYVLYALEGRSEKQQQQLVGNSVWLNHSRSAIGLCCAADKIHPSQ